MQSVSARNDLLIRICIGYVTNPARLDNMLMFEVPMEPMRPDQGNELYVKNALSMLQEMHGLKTTIIRDAVLRKWCGESWVTIMQRARDYMEEKEAQGRWVEIDDGARWTHGEAFKADRLPTWDMRRAKEIVQ